MTTIKAGRKDIDFIADRTLELVTHEFFKIDKNILEKSFTWGSIKGSTAF